MSFEDFIYENYEVKTTNRDDHIRICCPNCGDTNYHGYVNTSKNLFKCWKCHWSHKTDGEATTAYYFLKEFHGLSNREIFEVLNLDREIINSPDKTVVEMIKEFFAKEDGLWVDYNTTITEMKEVTLPEYTRKIQSKGRGIVNKLAYHYIKSRFPYYNTQSLIDKYNLHYSWNGVYKGYIIIPVTEWGELVWFQGRAFLPATKDPKYLGPTGLDKPVFGVDFCTSKDVVITEGIFDAMTLGDNTLCVFGSGLSKRQLKILSELDLNSVTVWFDWDGAGRSGARKLCKDLKNVVPEVKVVCNAKSDANSLGRKEALYFLENNTYNYNLAVDMWLKLGDVIY